MRKSVLAVFVIILLSAFGGIFSSSAQITLGTNDFPKSGKIYHLSTASQFPGMDATLTGANYSWDYSQLASTRLGAASDTFLTVFQTQQLYSLYFLASSNQAVAGTDVNLQGLITISNAFNFYNNTSSGYNQTGFGANVSILGSPSLPTPIGYSPQDVVYKFPLNYGNVDSSNSFYQIALPSIFYFGANMTRHNEVDGWGTLKTPLGTFNVLRLKSTIIERDTVHIDTILHYGMSFPPVTRVEYKWLGAGKGEPLLQINTMAGIVTQIVYQDSIRTIGVSEAEKLALDLTLFPNPASDEVHIQYTLSSPSDVLVEITDITGRILTTANNKNAFAGLHRLRLELPSTSLSSADYLVRLTTKYGQIVKPLVIAK